MSTIRLYSSLSLGNPRFCRFHAHAPHVRRSARVGILLAVLVAGSSPALAQRTIARFTINGGGGTSESATKNINGTIGQANAGESNVGPLQLRSGFWSVVAVEPTATFSPNPTETSPPGEPTLTPSSTPGETPTEGDPTLTPTLTDTPTPTPVEGQPTPTPSNSPTPTQTPTEGGPSPTPTESGPDSTPTEIVLDLDIGNGLPDGFIDANDLGEWILRTRSMERIPNVLFGYSIYWQNEYPPSGKNDAFNK